jgi:hypothetical protein
MPGVMMLPTEGPGVSCRGQSRTWFMEHSNHLTNNVLFTNLYGSLLYCVVVIKYYRQYVI